MGFPPISLACVGNHFKLPEMYRWYSLGVGEGSDGHVWKGSRNNMGGLASEQCTYWDCVPTLIELKHCVRLSNI